MGGLLVGNRARMLKTAFYKKNSTSKIPNLGQFPKPSFIAKETGTWASFAKDRIEKYALWASDDV